MYTVLIGAAGILEEFKKLKMFYTKMKIVIYSCFYFSFCQTRKVYKFV